MVKITGLNNIEAFLVEDLMNPSNGRLRINYLRTDKQYDVRIEDSQGVVKLNTIRAIYPHDGKFLDLVSEFQEGRLNGRFLGVTMYFKEVRPEMAMRVN